MNTQKFVFREIEASVLEGQQLEVNKNFGNQGIWLIRDKFNYSVILHGEFNFQTNYFTFTVKKGQDDLIDELHDFTFCPQSSFEVTESEAIVVLIAEIRLYLELVAQKHLEQLQLVDEQLQPLED